MTTVSPTVSSTRLRSRSAAALSVLYAGEVPAYGALVEVAQEVNQRHIAAHGTAAERLGSIERVTAERHGAIRVGSPRELAQVARIFGALGMAPVGFYDLRDLRPRPIPVVSTAFRPVERDELAANPFRVFTSVLVPEDRRFFDADLERRLRAFLDARRLFSDELLDLADAAERHGGLTAEDADRFLELATAAFALSTEPAGRARRRRLGRAAPDRLRGLPAALRGGHLRLQPHGGRQHGRRSRCGRARRGVVGRRNRAAGADARGALRAGVRGVGGRGRAGLRRPAPGAGELTTIGCPSLRTLQWAPDTRDHGCAGATYNPGGS